MNQLRKHRQNWRLGQGTLSERTGVSVSKISSIERNFEKPSFKQAHALTDFFGVKVEFLFPDGLAEQYQPAGPRVLYIPPPPEKPEPIHPPRSFYVRCWHCRGRIYLAAEGSRCLHGEDLRCVTCGAAFAIRVGDIVYFEAEKEESENA
jgi:DNA-binding XRE family transcriptional regulator